MLSAGICRRVSLARRDLKKVAITLHYGASSTAGSTGNSPEE
jgi:hypothetical protein